MTLVWPGDVRELQMVLTSAVVRAVGGQIEPVAPPRSTVPRAPGAG